MNIFNKVALRSLKKNRTRTIVTIIGVVLSSSLIMAAVTFGLSLMDYAAKGAALKYGGWHVAFLDASPEFAQERAADSEAADTVTIENIGYAMLDGGTNPEKPYVDIISFDQKAFDALPITLLSGRMPKNSSEILVSAHVAADGGVDMQLGDTVFLSVGSRMIGNEKLNQHDPYISGETLEVKEEKVYTVVGICGRPAFEEYTAPGYTLITKTDSAAGADSLNLFVTLKNPQKIRSYVAEKAENHDYIFNNDVLRFMGLSNDSGDSVFNILLYSVGGIVIVIIMIGSIFLIYNSFSLSLNERTQQVGILSSVGATAKQIRNSVLFEGFCIGAIGIPIGILTGIGGIWFVIFVVAKKFSSVMYSGVSLTLNVSVLPIAGTVVISLITILISAYIPAKKAADMPVMECIRQTNEVKMEPKALKTSKLTHRIYGLEGTLALKNFKRNKKRYRSIVLSLVLSIVLFIATSAFVIDLKQTMAKTLAFTTYDIGFGTKDMEDGEMLALYDRMKGAGGVTDSGYQAIAEYYCDVQANELSDNYWKSAGGSSTGETVELPMEIQFLDDSTYQKIVQDAGLSVEEYSGENAKMLAVAKMETGADEKKGEREVEEFKDLFHNSSLEAAIMPSNAGEANREQVQNVTVTCIDAVPPDTPPTREKSAYSKQDSYVFQLLAPWSLKEKMVPDGSAADLRVKGMTFSSENPAQSASEMKKMIQDAEITVSYMMINTSEMMEENRNYIFIANVFAYTFIMMISLIAVANVFNTISTNIKLRRKELAMLRSVGMSDRNFNKMMRFECALYGMKALLAGLPIAMIVSWLIYYGMFKGGADEIVYEVPWLSIGISIFSVLLIIFVTMMYAVSKIKKENIIDALRDDMT